MTALYQSPFLLALGWAIAASLWQVAVLWFLYQLVAGRKATPVFRHNFALLLLIVATTWFGYTFVQKYNELSVVATGSGFSALSLAEHPFSLFMFLQAKTLALLNRFLPYFSAAYLIILLLLTARLLKAWTYSRKLQSTGLLAIDDKWIDRVERYASRLGIVQQVRIYLSEYIDVPATLNYFKPVILLPVAAFNQLTPEQVESVILHELAHIKRKDYLLNILVSVIEILLFFNPFVHLMTTNLRKERENCCDDFVLQFRFDPHSYASALLSLEQMRMNRLPVTVLAATGNKNQLLGRVKRIMNVKNNSLNYGHRLLALLLVTFMLISIAWLVPDAKSSQQQDDREATPGYTVAEVKDEHSDTDETVIPDKPRLTPQRANPNKPVEESAPVAREEDFILPAPPAAPQPPAAPDNLLGQKPDDAYRQAWDELYRSDEHAKAFTKGYRNNMEGWDELPKETGNENLLAELEKNIRMAKDTVMIHLQDQAGLWEQLKSLGQLELEKYVEQLDNMRSVPKWNFKFIYDSAARVMESELLKKRVAPVREKKVLQKRDTIHLQAVPPKKVKKTIWVNRVDDDARMTYAVVSGDEAASLVAKSAGIATSNTRSARQLVASLSVNDHDWVITID